MEVVVSEELSILMRQLLCSRLEMVTEAECLFVCHREDLSLVTEEKCHHHSKGLHA